MIPKISAPNNTCNDVDSRHLFKGEKPNVLKMLNQSQRALLRSHCIPEYFHIIGKEDRTKIEDSRLVEITKERNDNAEVVSRLLKQIESN